MSKLCFRCGERKANKCFKRTNKYDPSPWCWNCTNTKIGDVPDGEYGNYKWGREIRNEK